MLLESLLVLSLFAQSAHSAVYVVVTVTVIATVTVTLTLAITVSVTVRTRKLGRAQFHYGLALREGFS